jgi:hypothetical protein
MKKQFNITFTNVGGIPEEYEPKPASKFIPDWYKNLESYLNGKKQPNGGGSSAATAKRCMPIFDAITAGYIIVSPADVFVSQRDGQPFYEWSNFGLIQFHPKEQAPEHPHRNGLESFPKWTNHWAIKTPKGYSTMFIPPVHRESVFSILPGVVDTDTYTAAVNFPFVLNDPKFEGLIPAGTPIAQVIPFKREVWEMKLGGQAEFNEQTQVTVKLQTKFFDRYKSMFRQPKEYK